MDNQTNVLPHSFSSNGNGSISGKVNAGLDLQAHGAVESGKMSGNAIGLDMWLGRIYNQALSKVKDLNDLQTEKIGKLSVEITGLTSHNETVEHQIKDIEERKIPLLKEKIDKLEKERNEKVQEKQNTVEKLQVEIEKIRGGDLSLIGSEVKVGDKIGFVLGIIILACLTLYLILFYTSVIYNAFILNVQDATQAANMKNKIFTATIVNLEAIPNTFSEYGIWGMFLILATAVFLGLGYLVHKFSQEKTIKSYIQSAGVYLFTLFFDGLLAYEIVKKIYQAQYLSGTVTVPWELNMAFNDPAFWIIISAGFVVYILWGMILSYTVEESDKLQPSKMAINVRKTRIAQLKNNIDDLKESFWQFIGKAKSEIEELHKKISEHLDKIQNNLTAIETKHKEIDKIKTTVEIPHSEVIDKLKTFSVGWTNYVNAAFVDAEKKSLIHDCNEVLNTFILKITKRNEI